MIFPESIDLTNKDIDLPWRSKPARAWARSAWKTLAPALNFAECDNEVDRTDAALHLVALATLYADFADLAFEQVNHTAPYGIVSRLDADRTLLGIMAERAGTVKDLVEQEGEWGDDSIGPWCVDRLVRRWRRKVYERLVAGAGGQRQLAVSLLKLWQADGGVLEVDDEVDDEGDDEAIPDPKRMDWSLLDVFTSADWCYDEDTLNMGRDAAWEMDTPTRVASWVKAGCPYLGPDWE